MKLEDIYLRLDRSIQVVNLRFPRTSFSMIVEFGVLDMISLKIYVVYLHIYIYICVFICFFILFFIYTYIVVVCGFGMLPNRLPEAFGKKNCKSTIHPRSTGSTSILIPGKAGKTERPRTVQWIFQGAMTMTIAGNYS